MISSDIKVNARRVNFTAGMCNATKANDKVVAATVVDDLGILGGQVAMFENGADTCK